MQAVPNLKPTHPGTVLRDDFLAPKRISQYRFARVIDVDPRRVNAIVLGKRAVTLDTAVLFARATGTSWQFWMNLQNAYDFEAGGYAGVGAAARAPVIL